MKKSVLLLALSLIPVSAFADNIGGCGWGSKLMDGNRGPAPQILAVTTNGSFGNQTFGISSGTSGCTQDGVVQSNWKLASYIDENRNKLASDISIGEGESLTALAALIGIPNSERAVFNATAKGNFDKLFPRSDVSTAELIVSLRSVLASSDTLSQYSAQL